MLHGLMSAHGRYAADAKTQQAASSFALPLIDKAIKGLERIPFGPLLIADFGAADGANSIEPISRALDALRERGALRPVGVVHTDIPGNDFSALCEMLETSPDRYTVEHPWARPLMAGRSPFGRVFSDGTLHFGWSASTLQWLSEIPAPVDGHFFAQLSEDRDARAAYSECSGADWLKFLESRAAELTVGAAIVIADVAVDQKGSFGAEGLFQTLNDALRDCVEKQLIDEQEYEAINYPAWFRSLSEVRAPFAPRFEAPGGEQLELEVSEPHSLEDPFRKLLEDGDVQGYAAAQAEFLEGFLGPSFAAALDQERPDAEREQAMAQLWERVRERVAEEPASPTHRLFTALIRRTR